MSAFRVLDDDNTVIGVVSEAGLLPFVISRHGGMRVPGVMFATRALIPDPR